LHQGYHPPVVETADFEVSFAALPRRLVAALVHLGLVAWRQVGGNRLAQATDEGVVKGRPEPVVFEERVHPREWARHTHLVWLDRSCPGSAWARANPEGWLLLLLGPPQRLGLAVVLDEEHLARDSIDDIGAAGDGAGVVDAPPRGDAVPRRLRGLGRLL